MLLIPGKVNKNYKIAVLRYALGSLMDRIIARTMNFSRLTKSIYLFIFAIAVVPYTEAERLPSDLQRDATSKGREVVALAGLSKGMTVLDLLAGSGYYSELIASAVGESGTVYLHNNKAYLPYVEKDLSRRLQANRLENVIRLDRELEDLGIEEESLDALFFILGYHDMYHVAEGWKVDKAALLAQIEKSIKKGGKLIIVDHAAQLGTGTLASQNLHRIDKRYVANELASYGFSLYTESQLLSNPKDDYTLSPFDPKIRRKTDRFVLVFIKR